MASISAASSASAAAAAAASEARFERVGASVSHGLIKGASGLGAGIKSTSAFLHSHQGHTTGGGGDARLRDKQRAEAAKSKQRADTFMKGASCVSDAVGKGCSWVGAGLAKTAHAVADTDFYQQHLAGDPDAPPSTTTAALKGTASSLGAIKTGVVESVGIVARDTRDARVDYVAHTQGDEAAALTKQHWDATGSVLVGTGSVVSVATLTTLGVGIRVGIGAASHDPNKKTVLAGGTWFCGWLARQEALGFGWLRRFVVLRTYSLCVYASDSYDDDAAAKEIYYVTLSDVRSVDRVADAVTQMPHSFELRTKSGSYFFSPGACGYADAALAQITANWLNLIGSLLEQTIHH